MQYCRAWSAKRRRRCRNTTAGTLCDFHLERLRAGESVTVVNDDGEPDGVASGAWLHDDAARAGEEAAPAPAPDLGDGPGVGLDLPPLGGEGVDESRTDAPFAGLPPAPDVADEPIAASPEAAPSPDAAELDRLERLAARYLGDVPDDPAEAEAAAEEEPIRPTTTAAGVLAGAWTPDRVERLLSWLNPYIEKSGKPPLSPAELREGGQVLAPVLADLLGDYAPGPYATALLWIAMTFGTRYAAEIAGFVRAVVRGRRPAVIEPVRPAETVDDRRRDPEPVASDAGLGWALVARGA